MSRKKLLLCTPSNALRGGVETIVNDLQRELPKRGWDAVIGLARGARFNSVEAYRTEYPDLSILEIDGTKGTRQARLEALTGLIKRVEPHVLMSARIFDAYEAVTVLKEKHRGPRLAVTIQTYEPHYINDIRDYRASVDVCVTAGNLIREAVIQWSGLSEDRVVAIPNGVNLPVLPVAPRRLCGALQIGYVGRLDEGQKRILDLIPFLESLDAHAIEYVLKIVGTGPLESQLKERLSAWVSKGTVVFHGWQDRTSLYSRFYPNLDCIIHFAHTEGVPIAPGEALMHGVVPVISEFTGLKSEGEFVNGVNALTFAVGDTETAANQVSRLAREPGLLERLSANAIRSLKGKYTFAGSMDAWAEAFDRCLEQAPAIGSVQVVHRPPDGRLAKLGLSPRVAQRVRDLLGVRFEHTDPGSEWPTGSGLMTEEAAAEIMRFASEYEASVERPVHQARADTGVSVRE